MTDQTDDLAGLRDDLIAVLQKYDAVGIIQITSQDALRSFNHIETSWLPFKVDHEKQTARVEIPESMPKKQAEKLLELGFEMLYRNICMLEETLVFNKRMLAHFLNQFGAEKAFWESKKFAQQGRTPKDPIN